MKFWIVLSYLLSMPLGAEQLNPLIFPGGLVEQVGEHKLMVTARGSAFNQALQATTAERPKQLTVENRRVRALKYVRGVPFVITEDRRGARLEWAVVTTFREGLSPRQTGVLTISTIVSEITGLALTHTWTGWAGVTAGVAAGAFALRPILTRQRGLRDLNLELRPVLLDGKPAAVEGMEQDLDGQIKEVYLDLKTPLSKLLFSPNQADRLSRPPAKEDVILEDPRLRLEDDQTLVARGKWYDSARAVELKADGRGFNDLFRFRGAWFVTREDQAFERVEVVRRGRDRQLEITLVPVTLNDQVVRAEAIYGRGHRVEDVKLTAEVIRDDLVDPTTRLEEFRLRGFPREGICAGLLNVAHYDL